MSGDLTMDSGALIFATLADVYLSSGMVDEAISILQDGLSRNPTYSLAKVILGRAYYIKGDTDQALKYLKDNYEDLKESGSANLYLGHCYRKNGDYEKAAEYYRIALKINPENKEAKQGLEAFETAPAQAVAEKPEPMQISPEPEKIEDAAVGVALPLDAGIPEEPVEQEPADKIPVEKVPPVIEQETIEPAKIPEPVVEEKAEPKQKEPVSPIVEEQKEEKIAAPEQAQKRVIEEPQAAEEKEAVIDIGLGEKISKPAPPQETMFPFEALEEPMKRLLNMKAVKGAFICSKDGLLIKSYYEQAPEEIEEISAMIAAIYSEAQDSFKYLKQGSVEKFIIDKVEYPICVITAGESLLTVITQAEAKPGLVFVYARKIIDEIREILG
jgi:predicted regulator of Ras-like GTPase activity (Roadblock/LC7/MglB family)